MYSSNKDISKEEIGVIAHLEEYFPLLCKVYLGDETEQKKLRFFEKPEEETEKEIKKLRQLCVEKHCVLFLFVLYNNDLCIEEIYGSEQFQKNCPKAL